MSSVVIWNDPVKRVSAEWNSGGLFTVTVHGEPDASGVSPVLMKTSYASSHGAIRAAKRRAKLMAMDGEPK